MRKTPVVATLNSFVATTVFLVKTHPLAALAPHCPTLLVLVPFCVNTKIELSSLTLVLNLTLVLSLTQYSARSSHPKKLLLPSALLLF